MPQNLRFTVHLVWGWNALQWRTETVEMICCIANSAIIKLFLAHKCHVVIFLYVTDLNRLGFFFLEVCKSNQPVNQQSDNINKYTSENRTEK